MKNIAYFVGLGSLFFFSFPPRLEVTIKHFGCRTADVSSGRLLDVSKRCSSGSRAALNFFTPPTGTFFIHFIFLSPLGRDLVWISSAPPTFWLL